ncbi:peptidoglycan D,D-transpeptidase FtsI family protein [Methyloligella solikamskensis]|uniref:Peptidoglycan D,D-transpeptidase FtsI family protein n=1 Tax=Methyloligella solikamskensis TaxID=1177756 RepID=A0ABW3JBL3_9HYPH
MTTKAETPNAADTPEGAEKPNAATARAERAYIARSRRRFQLICLGFVIGFLLVGGRLVSMGMNFQVAPDPAFYDTTTTVHRPDLLDRKGQLLATDIKGATLFADPLRVIDSDELVEKVSTVLPDIKAADIRKRINKGGRFVSIRRELTPSQQAEIHALGVPGLGFIEEYRRVYPVGATASHVVGFVDIDNNGLAGMERFVDQNPQLSFLNPETAAGEETISLSLDLGVQHVLHEELQNAIDTYKAKAAAGVVMDVYSGEVVGLASLPDYDPNHREQALDKDRHDRVTAGVYELGSIFKLITVAAGLDTGVCSVNSVYDATHAIKIGRFSIGDFHGLHRPITVEEVFTHSSNIGAAKIAVDVGVDRHKAFLRKLGLLDSTATELGETAAPLVPKHWKKLNTMTIAFGHGLSVTPLQFAAAAVPIVNGGIKVQPTFLPRSRAEGMASGTRVLQQSTSDQMVRLMRLNAMEGTGKQSNAEGYRVGGKTGTAEKVVNGRYARSALLNSFVATFPADAPEYVVLVMLDEPQKVEASKFLHTAGANAAPTVGRVIARIAPILGVEPNLDLEKAAASLPRRRFDDPVVASY